jgi:hypothetical protein
MAIFGGFPIMGAIGGLRRKPLAWLALNVRVASVYLID